MTKKINEEFLKAYRFVAEQCGHLWNDKADEPWIAHSLRVSGKCWEMFGEAEQIVGMLHDVLEDTNALEVLPKMQGMFSPGIINSVIALTRCEGESYTDYISRLCGNGIARRVKAVDLIDNMNLNRLKMVTVDDARRQMKYAKALHKILGITSLDV